MDGRIECIIRTCEDMSRVCTLDFNGSGDEYRSSNEIAYNKDIKRYLTKVYIKGHIDHPLDGLRLMKFCVAQVKFCSSSYRESEGDMTVATNRPKSV